MENVKTNTQMVATAGFTDSYTSKYRTYDLEFSRLNWNILNVSVGATFSENEYDLTGGTDEIWTYHGSIARYLKKRWTLSLFYERIEAELYQTYIGMLRISYRFKSEKKKTPPSP